MKTTSGRGLLAAITLLLAVTANAQPHPGIDQEQVNAEIGRTLAVGGTSEQKLAQTFTAGRNGQLSHVTLAIACEPAAILTVSIQETVAGVPSGAVLTARSLPGSLFPPIVPSPAVGTRIIEFKRQPRLATGKEYAIVIEAVADTCGLYRGPSGDPYAGGSGFFDARPNPPGWIPLFPGNDLVFQTFMR